MKGNGIILNGSYNLRRKYMKKGHGISEIALMLCFIAVISFAAISIYNHQKGTLVYMSKPTVSVNLSTMDTNRAQEKIISPYDKIETAGTNALTLLGMDDADDYKTAMEGVTYAKLQSLANGTNNDIFTLANELKEVLNLTSIDRVSPGNVTPETLSILTKILNAAADLPDDSPYKNMANSYITQVKSLLSSP